MFGPYLKLLLLMFAPNWNIIPQFGIHILKKDTLLLESVQKKFTRNVFLRCNISFRSYADRLDKLGIKSLEYRRLQFDIILMFKIYHKLSDLQFDNYFEHCDRKYNFRSHNFQIKSKLCTNTEQFRNFFFIRIINVWNKLPQDLVSAPNIVIFRNRLKNFNLYSIASLTF